MLFITLVVTREAHSLTTVKEPPFSEVTVLTSNQDEWA